MARLRALAANLALLLASALLFLAVCEFGVFRFVWLASDVPVNDFVDGVVRHAPNQSGIWRLRDEIAAPYRINAQGWNSGIGDYAVPRRPGVPRIAIVGDSFVEAFHVRNDRSLGERLAADLGSQGGAVEVYRFGISGAPLSQYLQMIEHEVVRYRPDCIVIILIHNDFDESYKFKPGRYTSSFLKLRVEAGRVMGEIPPRAWQPGMLDWMRQTATIRFFHYRWHVRPGELDRWIFSLAQARIAANADIGAALSEPENVRAVADYLFDRIDTAVHRIGMRLLLVMDGDRHAIYDGTDSPALALNRLAADAAARHRIPFLDLDPVFRADWQAEHRRFDFDTDAHWNEHGHAVAAAAIARTLRALSDHTASAP